MSAKFHGTVRHYHRAATPLPEFRRRRQSNSGRVLAFTISFVTFVAVVSAIVLHFLS